MSIMQSKPRAATEANLNADLARGLREIADFLEAHPGLPRFRALIHAQASHQRPREELIRLAEMLGERASEEAEYGFVHIVGSFIGNAHLRLSAGLASLGGRKKPEPEYDYEPIIKCDECQGRGGWEEGGTLVMCERCHGTGRPNGEER